MTIIKCCKCGRDLAADMKHKDLGTAEVTYTRCFCEDCNVFTFGEEWIIKEGWDE